MATFYRRELLVRAPETASRQPRWTRCSRTLVTTCVALGLAVGLAATGHAQLNTDELAAIQRRLEQQETEIRALHEQLNSQGGANRLPAVVGAPELVQPAPAVGQPTPAPGASRSPGEESVGNLPDTTQIAALKGTSAAYPTFRVTGFTQLDTAFYSQDPRNTATVGDAQDGTGFRRVRMAVVGNAAEFTTYMLEVDFVAAGKPSLFDVWVEQANIPVLGAVTAGQYVQPFSIDAESGFRNLPFLERSLPFLAFVPFRRVGVMSTNWDEEQRTVWANSVFRTGGFNNAPLGDDRFGLDIGDVGGFSYSTRLTHLMYYDDLATDRYLWEVGGAFD